MTLSYSLNLLGKIYIFFIVSRFTSVSLSSKSSVVCFSLRRPAGTVGGTSPSCSGPPPPSTSPPWRGPPRGPCLAQSAGSSPACCCWAGWPRPSSRSSTWRPCRRREPSRRESSPCCGWWPSRVSWGPASPASPASPQLSTWRTCTAPTARVTPGTRRHLVRFIILLRHEHYLVINYKYVAGFVDSEKKIEIDKNIRELQLPPSYDELLK